MSFIHDRAFFFRPFSVQYGNGGIGGVDGERAQWNVKIVSLLDIAM